MWFRLWSVWESVLWSSLEPELVSREIPLAISRGTHREGLKLLELFLDCFLVVKSQIVGEHVADFLRATLIHQLLPEGRKPTS